MSTLGSLDVTRLERDLPTLQGTAVASWVRRLADRLEEQRVEAARGWDYYEGRHPLPQAPQRILNKFLRLAEMAQLNMCELVVNAPAERLRVDGWNLGQPDADAEAWRWWKRNDMAAESRALHDEVLVTGRGAVIVWRDDDGPEVTAETSDQVAVALTPGGRKVVAAMKAWTDEWTDAQHVTLYLPDGLIRLTYLEPGGWTPRAGAADEWLLENPFSRVPVVPFTNRWRLNQRGGRSELGPTVTSIQNRLNKTVFDRLTAAEMTAIRQRWATGIEMPADPETGQPLTPESAGFDWAVDRFWHTAGTDVSFGEFGETSLGPFVASVEADIQHLAAITRTPPHYLLGQSGAFPSGESLAATEMGLVAKVERMQSTLGDSWESVMSLLAEAGGLDLGDVVPTVKWSDPQKRTEGPHVDAVMKKQALGVPQRQLWHELGYDQAQIAAFEAEQVSAALTGQLTAGGADVDPLEVANALQKVVGAVPGVISVEEAREIVNEVGGNLSPEVPEGVGAPPSPLGFG